jgi:aminopeptidase N
VLQAYYAQYLHQSVTTADFIAVAEAVSGKDLAAFFDAWLHDPFLPPIKAMALEPV